MRIALAQLDQPAGDVAGNAARVRAAIRAGRRCGASLVVAPARSLSGTPAATMSSPVSLKAVLEALAGDAGECAAVVGFVDTDGDACALLRSGSVEAIARRDAPCIIPLEGLRVGIVAGDGWDTERACRVRGESAAVLVVADRSRYRVRSPGLRVARAAACGSANASAVVYVNRVGSEGTDVFDGASFVLDAAGGVAQQLPAWHEAIAIAAFEGGAPRPVRGAPDTAIEPDLYHALVTAVRGHVQRHRSDGVSVVLADDIAAALLLVVAADALGRDRVVARARRGAETCEAHDVARFAGVRVHAGSRAFAGFPRLSVEFLRAVLSRAGVADSEAKTDLVRVARYRQALGRFAPDRLLATDPASP